MVESMKMKALAIINIVIAILIFIGTYFCIRTCVFCSILSSLQKVGEIGYYAKSMFGCVLPSLMLACRLYGSVFKEK